ncbi:MAG: hypothetical protein IJE17_00850 [Clostridia bacterium]|nr:hypothetical protein [Clostridia bacterium]
MPENPSVRQLLANFSHPILEALIALIDREGEKAMYGGFPALEDDTFMVRGAIMQAVATLAIYDQKTGDLRFADNLRRMSSFSSLFIGQPTKTWGKLKLLMGLSDLMDAGLLASVSPEAIAIYRQASDYSDFLDKETLFLHGLPTNYYHVAMACAAYREKLGWENEGMADRIRDKILGVMQDHSSEGWSDEQPPHGRFDTYSINVPMELVPPLMQTGHEVPPSALENLRKAALVCLQLRNPRGDGFPYGRSLAVHGDLSPVEVLSTALELGLIAEADRPHAIAYIGQCIRKIREFWYDPELGFLNIWLKGRATNEYRNISRILSVNVETHVKLLAALAAAEKLGYADLPLTKEMGEMPKNWACEEIIFDRQRDKMRALYLLRKGDLLFALPLIGGGRRFLHAAYLPFPAMPRLLEAPQDHPIPFLTPHYILADGRLALPAGFYENIQVEQGEDRVVITAQGRLSLSDPPRLGGNPEANAPYTAVYTFAGSSVSAQFDTEAEVTSVKMLYAGDAYVEGAGFDTAEPLDVSEQKYHTPHGAPVRGMQWTGKNARVGYTVTISGF